MLSTEIINFGKQMDAAQDKQMLIDLAEGCTNVLDLGAGTGAISRAIAKKWGCHVDAVDVQFKEKVKSSKFVTYHRCRIEDYALKWETDPKTKKYDCVVLSAIIIIRDNIANGYHIRRIFRVVIDMSILNVKN